MNSCAFFLALLSWSCVVDCCQSFQVSLSDRDVIKKQLGYVPSNFLCVSARTTGGSPISIRTYPLQSRNNNREDGLDRSLDISLPPSMWPTPFPTHYWLTCPDIARAIGELERFGYIGCIVDYLNQQYNFDKRQHLLRCHQQCGIERWETLSLPDQFFFLQYEKEYKTVAKMKFYIRDSGIAGTYYQDKLDDHGFLKKVNIKCLHTHYAHFRSTTSLSDDSAAPVENPVGRIIHDLLLKKFPLLEL